MRPRTTRGWEMGDVPDGGGRRNPQDGSAISAMAAGPSGKRNGGSAMNRTMNRTTIAALAVVAIALLLAGGVVLAKAITCTAGVTCTGTEKADQITGSFDADIIKARGGNDTIDGGNGSDTINGGRGSDTITDIGNVPDVDTITGGKGNDSIDVREGAALNDNPDFVDCGPGTDTVFIDANDTRLNCEIFNPN
jgi:Ca2+-binding RTX toxin-like protein